MSGKTILCLLLLSICFAKDPKAGPGNGTEAPASDDWATRIEWSDKVYFSLFDFMVKTPENSAGNFQLKVHERVKAEAKLIS